METFTAEIDNIFDEKGLSWNMYQFYTDTKFMLYYNGYMALGDLTAGRERQITFNGKILEQQDDEHSINEQILHTDFILILTNKRLILRINSINTEILNVKDFLVFDDQNWCYLRTTPDSKAGNIIKMFNDQEVGVIASFPYSVKIMKIEDQIGVYCYRNKKLTLYNNELNSVIVTEHYSVEAVGYYYNNCCYGLNTWRKADGSEGVKVNCYNLVNSELSVKKINIVPGKVGSMTHNDFIAIQYEDCLRFINIHTNVKFRVKVNNLKDVTQCGDFVIILQKFYVTKVNLKTLEVTRNKWLKPRS